MAKHAFVVFGSAREGHEAEFNTWYDQVHIPAVLKIPGFVAAQRYGVVQRRPEETTRDYRYMVVYEIDAEDVEGAIAELRRRVAAGIVDSGTLFRPDMLGFYTATAGSERIVAGR